MTVAAVPNRPPPVASRARRIDGENRFRPAQPLVVGGDGRPQPGQHSRSSGFDVRRPVQVDQRDFRRVQLNEGCVRGRTFTASQQRPAGPPTSGCGRRLRSSQMLLDARPNCGKDCLRRHCRTSGQPVQITLHRGGFGVHDLAPPASPPVTGLSRHKHVAKQTGPDAGAILRQVAPLGRLLRPADDGTSRNPQLGRV